MNADPYPTRRDRAAALLRAAGADALVCAPGRTLQYLTGLDEEPSERHFLLVVPADGDPALLVPELSGAQVRAGTDVADVRTWDDGDDPVAAVRALLADRDLREGRSLVDDRMWARFTADLRAAAPAATWGLASEALAGLRIRKDPTEIAALRAAAAVADAVVDDLRALGPDAVGRTEAELADWIEERLAVHGGDGVAFETIVGAGPNGARPHHRHGDREVRAGEPVVLDFGTRVDGYPSDQTRTLVFDGEPSAEYRAVHEVVREAQRAAVDAVEPGATAGSIDRAARAVIEAAGHGDAFVHRTGHGVGLDVHEEPYIVAGNDHVLEPGTVFSVEPGVYREGAFGCRIEDLVLVTDEGAERLNTTGRGWRCGGDD
ncbi:M24 family metallopeptidase [Halorubrum sp. JWXQ-INN 858]|uniref:M24 family metallopeptidase n=1 Tax=Halorubrum sp. JWXQ-INN 858 TaxID=2690782 RepID=UPI00135B0D14|nr:M24 family metallopeptidase [Halorubrum sp. JWXQ-INN 858]MWV65852.1 M24 family metallopeptidase [Halorubrum sp. JWXQ-INN 858]